MLKAKKICVSFLLFICGIVSAQESISTDPQITYLDNHSMRENLKVGLGFGLGSALHSLGPVLDLNFEDDNSVFVGFASVSQIHSFQISWKHTYPGLFVSPYFNLGYAHWFSQASRADVEDESSILKQTLSSSEKRSGQFAKNFLVGSLGLQYNQLSGDFVGASFYAEVSLLAEAISEKLLPYGGAGVIYYF